MNRSRECLVVVPARGGSVAVPRKNVADVAGRPLLSWTLEAATNARHVDEIVVSTDDDEIADLARRHGAAVDARPPRLAIDSVHAVEVILELLERRAEQGRLPQDVVMLLPTSPLRSSRRIDESVQLLRDSAAPAVIGVFKLDKQLTNLRYIQNGELVAVAPAPSYNVQRQSQPDLYAVNGAIFTSTADHLRRHGSFHVEGAKPLVMSATESIDVNIPADLQRAADALIAQRNGA